MFGGTFGTQELILILILVLVLFGAKRIPEIMRGFGQGLREFKRASQEAIEEIDQAASAELETKPKDTTLPPADTEAAEAKPAEASKEE